MRFCWGVGRLLRRFIGSDEVVPRLLRRWTLIATENGDPASQFNLYHDLIESDLAFDRARAMFWLRKAASVDAEARKTRVMLQSRDGRLPAYRSGICW